MTGTLDPVAVTTVTGQKGNGVEMSASPQNCKGNCAWAQTVTRTGDSAHGPKTDRGSETTQPLYGGGPHLYDAPYNHEGGMGGKFTATSILGTTDQKNKAFSVLGAMVWGYSVDNKGHVLPMGPRPATRAELAASIAVLKRESVNWTIGP